MKGPKKLNKETYAMISEINAILRSQNIKDESNELFRFGCDWLLKKNMYWGFNFFRWESVNFNPLTGESSPSDVEILTLAGSSIPSKFDCLQIYTDAFGCENAKRMKL